MVTYSIQERFGTLDQVAGKTLGQYHLRPLVDDLLVRKLTLNDGIGELVVLDVSGIEAMTSSYVRATILWLLQAGQLYASGAEESAFNPDTWERVPLNIFPAITGLTDEARTEVGIVLAHDRFPCLEALEYSSANRIHKAQTLGKLEKTAADTMDKLMVSGTATATALFTRYPEERINVTGWNNRLADLYRLRLVRRAREGKQWLYEPVAEEIVHG